MNVMIWESPCITDGCWKETTLGLAFQWSLSWSGILMTSRLLKMKGRTGNWGNCFPKRGTWGQSPCLLGRMIYIQGVRFGEKVVKYEAEEESGEQILKFSYIGHWGIGWGDTETYKRLNAWWQMTDLHCRNMTRVQVREWTFTKLEATDNLVVCYRQSSARHRCLN